MALTRKQLEALASNPEKTTIRVWDGGGLYAQVSPQGVISFAMKYRERGKERRAGFGRFPAVSLEEARKKAREIRVKLDRKEAVPNPRAAQISTFKDAANEWLRVNESRLK